MPVIECESKNEYEVQLANNGSKLIVVDFIAARCDTCQLMKPKFDKLSDAYPNVVFLRMDIHEYSEIAKEMGVTTKPAFIYIKHGDLQTPTKDIITHMCSDARKVDELTGTNLIQLEAKINKYMYKSVT